MTERQVEMKRERLNLNEKVSQREREEGRGWREREGGREGGAQPET